VLLIHQDILSNQQEECMSSFCSREYNMHASFLD
jgi:hypothetical protein